MYDNLTDRENKVLEWIEKDLEPSFEDMLPAEVCCLRRAARKLDRMRTEYSNRTELAEVQNTLALKISQARSWGISWECIGEMIGISAFEAEELFNDIKGVKAPISNSISRNRNYQGADQLKQSAEDLFRIESSHVNESEIVEAQIDLIHRISKATAWDIAWPRIGEIIGMSGTEAEDLFDRITEAAEMRAEAVDADAECAPEM